MGVPPPVASPVNSANAATISCRKVFVPLAGRSNIASREAVERVPAGIAVRPAPATPIVFFIAVILPYF